MADQLSSIRRTFDERLIALEAGLADPDNCSSLEALVLDLARASGDEADAAAHDAVLRAQREANTTTAVAMADAAQAHVMLDAERAVSANLRAEIATLRGHLSTAMTARHDADAARQREITGLTATIAQFQQARDEARLAATNSADGLASATARADATTRERDALTVERDALLIERKRLNTEHADAARAARNQAQSLASATERADAATRDREALVAERDSLLLERDRLKSEHAEAARAATNQFRSLASAAEGADAAMRDRAALIAERDSLLTERDRLKSERADFVRAHDAISLNRDTLVHERDDIVRERDREIVRLREELTAAHTLVREKTPSLAASKAAASKAAAQSGAHPPLQPGPERQSDRQAFSSALGVQIDGEAALLVDLSVTGAQVLSCASLRPAKTVKMLLPSSEMPVLCRGKIVWARLEPTSPGKPIRYRAGMLFTATDPAAVQTFITRHGARS